MLDRRGFIVTTACALATTRANTLARAGDAASDYMGLFAKRGDFFGSAALRAAGSTTLASVGFANVKRRQTHNRSTQFLLGSISKHFTAVGILLLARGGKLNLSDALTRFLPELPQYGGVTIEQVLRQRGGLARDFPNIHSFDEPEQAVGFARSLALAAAPGSAYGYSNVGYSLLAAIIQRASNATFGGFIESRLLNAANMKNSGSLSKRQPPHLATAYVPGFYTDVEVVPDAWKLNFPGAGSIYSTVADMLLWDSALWGGHILSNSELDEFAKDRGDGYGYGVISGVRDGHRVVGHDGQTTGFISRYDHFPDDNAALIFLGNVDTGCAAYMKTGLSEVLFKKRPAPPALPKLARDSISAAVGRNLAGTYSVGGAFDFSVQFEDGRLFIPGNGGLPSPLTPIDSGGFFYRQLYASLVFSDQSVPAREISWTDISGTYRCPRKN